jgi:peptide/nickel transport system ATP-binding protein
MSKLVSIDGLTVTFTGRGKPVRAVDHVSMTVDKGSVLVLLGESGSGKSVTLRSLLRLHPPRNSRIEGRIIIDGHDVMSLSESAISALRGRIVSMIFQEPMLALDPVYTLGQQMTEAIMRHEDVTSEQAHTRALELFERVQIPSPARRLNAYPHEMSGGMRQRAMIALALACRPKLLLADEPTTALDATVQIQILLLLRQLQRELGLSIIFVTHDIGVAVEIADRIAVMYAGRIIESGSVVDILRTPRHPYTQGLLASRVERAKKGDRLETIPGSPPDLASLPAGCAFAPRCHKATDACRLVRPELMTYDYEHAVACHHI